MGSLSFGGAGGDWGFVKNRSFIDQRWQEREENSSFFFLKV